MKQDQLRIAVIDDDLSSREAIAGLVNAIGFATETFSTALEFLNLGGPRDHCCLIVDVNMPGMSGLELQSRLSASGSLVPMILVTSSPFPETRARALSGGAVGFLGKPCDPDELADHILRAQNA